MTPEDPLQGLRPLREPPPVGWWPPAPGWWLLAALLLALLCALAVWLWRRHRRIRYRRQAADELHTLRVADLTGSEQIQSINALLKRTALAAYPAESVAPLGGDAWMAFLDRTLPADRRVFGELDSNSLYHPDPSPAQVDAFAAAALTWVRHHHREAADA